MSEDIYVESKLNKNIVQVAHTNVKESEKLAETYAKNAEKSSIVCQSCVNTVQNIITEYENEIVENTYDDTQLRTDLAEVRGSIPAKTSDLTNDSGFITSSDVPSNVSELANDSGFISGITGSDVSDALGYAPANDSGLVHNTGTETVAGEKTFTDKVYHDKNLYVKNTDNNAYEPVLTYPSSSDTYATKRLGNVPSDVTSIPPTTLYNFDGQWVPSIVKIVDSVSNTSGTNIYLDSNGTSGAGQNYLPDDNYKYEVIFQIRMGCNTSQSTQVTLNCGTDIIDTNLSGEIFTVSKNATAITVVFTMPVGTSRYFKYSLSNSTSNTTACRVTAIGYRRIGTNS